MATQTLLQKFQGTLHAFRTAKRGNVVVTFALATVPIMGFVGSAVDYSRANSAKAAMQAAVDATALMLSKNVATLTTSQINTEATSYFKAIFNRPEVTGVVITPTYTTSSGTQLLLTGTGTVATTFMKVMGMSTMNITVSSTVKWGNTRLRVALVLDNTGSMADSGKITALKTATKNLLTQLQSAAAQNGDVYVSIVPFVKDVNVDPVNYTQNWIDWTDWNANNGSCSKSGSSTQSACVATGSCSNNNYSSQSSCVSHNKTWTPATWTHDNHNTWTGCVMDRGDSGAPDSGNYDTNVSGVITSNTATMYPAEQYDSCPAATVMALNYNWTAMTSLVNNMSPNGNTNQAIGLQLGWMSLVGGGPFPTPPAMDPNYQYSQVIILLTDGLNTQDRWYSDQTSIDNRQALTCANVKAAGITLYTIQVDTGGDPTSTLLQNCASNSSKFFLLTSSSAIITTFQQIGTALSDLRVAK